MWVKVSPSEFLHLLQSPPYLRNREKIIFCCSQTHPSIFNQSSPNLDEVVSIFAVGLL